MKLFESINSQKGITLNSQLIDLLSIIDDNQLSVQEQNLKINEYIENLRDTMERRKQAINLYGSEGVPRFLVDEILSENGAELLDIDREKIKEIYVAASKDLSIMDTDKMKQLLKKNGYDENIATEFLYQIKDNDYFVKERHT